MKLNPDVKSILLTLILGITLVALSACLTGSSGNNEATGETGIDIDPAETLDVTVGEGTIASNPGSTGGKSTAYLITGTIDESSLSSCDSETEITTTVQNDAGETLAETTGSDLSLSVDSTDSVTLVFSQNGTQCAAAAYSDTVVRNLIFAVPSGEYETIELGSLTDQGNGTFLVENEMYGALGLANYFTQKVFDSDVDGVPDFVSGLNATYEQKECDFSTITPYSNFVTHLSEGDEAEFVINMNHEVASVDIGKFKVKDTFRDTYIDLTEDDVDVKFEGFTIKIHPKLLDNRRYRAYFEQGFATCLVDGEEVRNEREINTAFQVGYPTEPS